MNPLMEYARNHTAIKQERAHTGVDVTDQQVAENGNWTDDMLEGTGIESGDLALLTAEAMKNVGEQLVAAEEVTLPVLLQIIGSVWSDGVIFGACYVRDNQKAAQLWKP